MTDEYELAIIGAGAAGCAASIYAGRSGVKAVMFDEGIGGGMTSTAPEIENYPGFDSVSGLELSQKFVEHAKKYVDFHMGEKVEDIKKKDNGFIIATSYGSYNVKAVILCTGATYRKLGVEGEKEFVGKGVSYCATCDGFFFKDKRVAVVGGGNTALLDAIYLKQIGCKEVYLIHRRDVLRGEEVLQKEAKEKGISFVLNSVVKSINGKDTVESVTIKNMLTDKEEEMEIEGVFVAVGEEPQNWVAKRIGVKLDDHGYVIVDRWQRTSVEGVYAAGDVTGGVRQIVTACAEGAVAALSSTEVLGKKYPY
ncbi:MAG TPA: thioredoxin-disulfide reductase [Thermoplasmata archaeon]|nr:thioredoxin-disulfide reductase [Thermoplasmata archaeon]